MTKLAQILTILTPKDRKKFRELITSSLFGGKAKHLAMFDLYVKTKVWIRFLWKTDLFRVTFTK